MIVVAEEIVLEEGTIEGVGVRDAIRIVEEESRKESGCLTYAFSVDITDSTIIRVYELWESMEALESHFKAPHIAVFQKALGGIQPKSMDAKVYEIKEELVFPSVE